MSSLTLTGAVCFAAPLGWAAIDTRRLGSRLLTVALSLLVAPAAVLVLISPAAAIASLVGLAIGIALRLLVELYLTQRAVA